MASNRKNLGLLVGHLERVSGKVLAQYPDIVREMIKGKAGVYALYKRGRLYYVGLARDLRSRLKTHLRDRHNNAWDEFSVYITSDDADTRELEALLLRIVSPDGNRVAGKLKGATALRGELNQRMRDHDADRRAELLGGHIADRRRRSRARGSVGAEALQNLASRRVSLRGWHNDVQYKASLLKDGKIRFKAALYPSPQAAATAAVGRRINGWWFWHLRDRKGEWVRLKSLKR